MRVFIGGVSIKFANYSYLYLKSNIKKSATIHNHIIVVLLTKLSQGALNFNFHYGYFIHKTWYKKPSSDQFFTDLEFKYTFVTYFLQILQYFFYQQLQFISSAKTSPLHTQIHVSYASLCNQHQSLYFVVNPRDHKLSTALLRGKKMRGVFTIQPTFRRSL